MAGLTGVVLRDPIAGAIVGNYYYPTATRFAETQIVVGLVFGLLVAGGVLQLILDIVRIERFYEFHSDRLRELYIRTDTTAEQLILESNKLRDAIRRGGPQWRRALRRSPM